MYFDKINLIRAIFEFPLWSKKYIRPQKQKGCVGLTPLDQKLKKNFSIFLLFFVLLRLEGLSSKKLFSAQYLNLLQSYQEFSTQNYQLTTLKNSVMIIYW